MPESRILKNYGSHPNFGFINVNVSSLQIALLGCRDLAEKIELIGNEESKKLARKIIALVFETNKQIDQNSDIDDIGEEMRKANG